MESELDITRSLIPQFFHLHAQEAAFLEKIGENRAAIEAFLSARFKDMLEEDMAALVNAMYRIDIAEKAFHEAMAHPDRADRLASLVIDRLIQKAKTRIWYRDRDA